MASSSMQNSPMEETIINTDEEECGDNMLNSVLLLDRINTNLGTSYKKFRYCQAQAITSISNNKDTLCILPTGYGKTVIFLALPYISSDFSRCLIISPLNAILAEQVSLLGNKGVLLKHESDIQLITDTTRFLLGHPETITSDWFKKHLKSSDMQIRCVGIDECHCVLKWGESKFRPAFLKIHTLHSYLPRAVFVAVTATASLRSRRSIMQNLHMEDACVITLPPTRSNIYLEVHKRPSPSPTYSVEDTVCQVVDPYLHELLRKGTDFEKSIIYSKLETCGFIHRRARDQYGINCDAGDSGDVQCLIHQYTGPQTAAMKDRISSSMKKKNSTLRLLLATDAYGMGADSPNVIRVVHVGVPRLLEDYVQQIGRSGRDGSASKAALHYNAKDIAANVKGMDDAMRMYCTTTQCRRVYIAEYFGSDVKSTQTGHHTCCDNCKCKCKCAQCASMDAEETTEDSTLHTVQEDIENLRLYLKAYIVAENNLVVDSTCPELVTGLCNELIDIICASPQTFKTESALKEEFPHIRGDYIINLAKIVSKF